MHQDLKKVLISQEEIELKCRELADIISRDYKDQDLLVVGLLKGCVPFIGDLTKYIHIPMRLDYMDVSSYHGGTYSTGQVKVIKDLDTNIFGLNVLIAEDIVDTGVTLKTVMDMFYFRGAKTVKVVTLLDKPEGRVVELIADYVGFTIPKEFVVGYGLDYEEYYRNLPYVGVLKEKIYSK